MKSNLILVDYSHLAYRSWNVFSKFKTKTGILTGVPFGVIRTFEHLKKKVPDSQVVFTLDGSPRQRQELLPTYKASRESNEFVYEKTVQDLTHHMMLACGAAFSYHPEFESDDLIGMLTRSQGFEKIYIYSGDDDFCQLVTDGSDGRTPVELWKPPPSTGTGKERFVTEADVTSEWGVKPSSLALYRSFIGDSSDEIKGLPRVPRGTLQHALYKCSTPDEFYLSEALTFFTKEWIDKLWAFRAQCNLNYRITKLPFDYLTDVPMQYHGIDPVGLRLILEQLEFNSVLKKFDDFLTLCGRPANSQSSVETGNESIPGVTR